MENKNTNNIKQFSLIKTGFQTYQQDDGQR